MDMPAANENVIFQKFASLCHFTFSSAIGIFAVFLFYLPLRLVLA